MTALLLAWAVWAAAAPAADWVVVPAPAAAAKARWKDARFSVDPLGRPWVAHDRRDLECPADRTEFRFAGPVDGFAQLGTASPLLSLDGRLGVVPIVAMVVDDASGRPVLPFKAIRPLPRRGCRLAPGAKDALYALCKSGADSELWVLPKGKGGRFVLLLKGKGDIAAAAGDGERNFAAVGPVVYRLGAEATPVLRHPDGPVRDLAFDPALGLFYATDREVGRAKPEGLERLLTVARPQIRLQGGSLYVFSEADWGVARLNGL